MVSQKIEEQLPPGWKEHVKVKNGRKIKYFTNLASGERLYSKKRVFHAHSLEISQGNSPSCNPDNETVACKSKASTSQDDVEANDSPEWLPRGWIVESRARRGHLGSGSIYKIYMEPLTGSKFYSKPQVMRYLQGLENKNDGRRQQRQVSKKTPLKRQDLSPSVEAKISLSAKNKNVAAEPYSMGLKDKAGLNELPSGYTKEINTRKRAQEKRNALLVSESLEHKNQIPGDNENDLAKPLKIDFFDVQHKNGLDELPAGWIKVSKTRKYTRGARSDPYYIEFASGYAFRSKKDVMRYLDTGDINSCAIKPHKWDSSELKQKEDTLCSTPYPGNEAGKSAARRQPFINQEPEYGKESSQISNLVAAEAENPGGKDKEKVKNTPALATKLTASSIVDQHLGSGATAGGKSRKSSGLKVQGSKQDRKIVDGNMAINGTAGLNDQTLAENCLDSKTKTDSRKSLKRKPPSTPGRSSKRLAGHDPEMQPNFSLTERALRAAIKKRHEVGVDRTLSKARNTTANEVALQQPVTQAAPSPSLTLNTAAGQAAHQPFNELKRSRSTNMSMSAVANKMPMHPVITEAETTTVVHCTSVSAEVSLETDLQNNFKSPPENQVLQQTSTGERQVEENTMPQVDYWSDPCWDFAFKTLTGAIPLEETLTLPGCFPQPTGASYTQENLTFGLPGFDIPPIFQNEVQQTAPQQNNVPVNQLSTNSTLPPAGNSINLPGCSSQPSLEAQSKDYQTKVKS